MHIVGGLYRELCDTPFWDTTMGSGARSALAVIALSPSTEFTTYASTADQPAILALQSKGIITTVTRRPSPIVFAYFHPLSSPHIEPPRDVIPLQPSLHVTGQAVLRFGCLEGDAVVTAGRAVYDPQTWRNPQAFATNGSTADELALVMNELEIREASGIHDLDLAARHLIQSEGAQVLVIKKGACGATVYDVMGEVSHVPAYRSEIVFKIGTGDIFSAVFAHYWAEMKLPAPQAADLASRSVSVYCETRTFQFDQASLAQRQPVRALRGSKIRLEGGTEAIGQRYTLEEARFILHELGMVVVCPDLEPGLSSWEADVTLAINDGLPAGSLLRIAQDRARGTPVIVLNERSGMSVPLPTATLTTTDFTTAMYFSAWAAGEAVVGN